LIHCLVQRLWGDHLPGGIADELRSLLNQLEKSLEANLYYVSLMTALTIPDIAAALESDDGLAKGSRYVAWYEKWVRPRFSELVMASLPEDVRQHMQNLENPLTGEACYLFRCALLHQGTTQHPKAKYSRIIFIEPGATTNVIHYGQMNDVLMIDLPSFCREVIAGTSLWFAEAEKTDSFRKNYDRFVRRYEGGLKPYIVGVPVIG
jgi:hypothetical protein